MLDSIKIKMFSWFSNEVFIEKDTDIYVMVAANNGYFLVCILDEQNKNKLVSDTHLMHEFIKLHANIDDYDAMSKLFSCRHGVIAISSCVRLYNPCINYARIIEAAVTSHGGIEVYERDRYNLDNNINSLRASNILYYYNNTENDGRLDCKFVTHAIGDYTVYIDKLKRCSYL